jgi:hypothetical protein
MSDTRVHVFGSTEKFERAMFEANEKLLDLYVRWLYADDVCEPEEDVFV